VPPTKEQAILTAKNCSQRRNQHWLKDDC